jgi:hypothetical protein
MLHALAASGPTGPVAGCRHVALTSPCMASTGQLPNTTGSSQPGIWAALAQISDASHDAGSGPVPGCQSMRSARHMPHATYMCTRMEFRRPNCRCSKVAAPHCTVQLLIGQHVPDYTPCHCRHKMGQHWCCKPVGEVRGCSTGTQLQRYCTAALNVCPVGLSLRRGVLRRGPVWQPLCNIQLPVSPHCPSNMQL